MWTGSWNTANTIYTGVFTDAVAMMTWTGTVTIQSDSAFHFVWDGHWSSTLTPDGSFNEAPATGTTGVAAGSVETVWGAASFGALYAKVPHYGGGQFYTPLLNGVPMNPAGPSNWAQYFFVGFGGILFALLTADQFINSWSDNSFTNDDSTFTDTGFPGFPGVGGAIAVPAGVPTPASLPSTTWTGPYTPSPDGTSISGGAGSLVSARGDGGEWTFGAPSGGGWILQRQGVPVAAYDVTDMQVNAQGSLFFRTVDGVWHVWNCWQANPCTGPTAGPIPILFNCSPSMPQVTVGSPDGTLVCMVDPVMSDGSVFSGTLSVGLDVNTGLQRLRNSGNNTIVTNGAYTTGTQSPVTVTQNGSSVVMVINSQ